MSQHIERVSELNNDEIQSFINQGYQRIDFYFGSYLYDPTHWMTPVEGQTIDYVFDDVFFKSLTKEAKDLAISEGYEDSKFPLNFQSDSQNMREGKHSFDSIEEDLGGCFLDDFLNKLGYPSEEKVKICLIDKHIHIHFDGRHWVRSTLFSDDERYGCFVDDFKELK